jgi:hypothetical protein
MAEYAEYRGARIKIGTCEDLTDLRADQAALVTALPKSVDPIRDKAKVRFRFPWPDEDGVEPGGFSDPDRSLPLPGLELPAELADEHYEVQFTAACGYLCSLPCPEGAKVLAGVHFHRGSFAGAVHLYQQRWWNGLLVAVLCCGGCGLVWRLEALAAAQPAIDALNLKASEQPDASERRFYGEVAERLAAGYRAAPER